MILHITNAQIEKQLKQALEQRDIILTQLKEAREQGDLSENFDYHQARIDQSANERLIKELKEANKQDAKELPIVPITINGIKRNIVIGTETDAKHADVFKDPLIISDESPVGKSLIIIKENNLEGIVKSKHRESKLMHHCKKRNMTLQINTDQTYTILVNDKEVTIGL